MRKLLVIALSVSTLSIVACIRPTTTILRPVRPFSNPRDTPIVIAGGSIDISSDTVWTLQGDNSYTTTISAEVKRISVVNRDVAGAERKVARPDAGTSWTVHLITTDGGDSTIAATPGTTKLIRAKASPGSEWYISTDQKKLHFIPSLSETIDQVNIVLTSPASTISATCQTDSEHHRPKGHCVIHFRTQDSPPPPPQ
jgi:hypothetical protein